jgi:hypothetical protein
VDSATDLAVTWTPSTGAGSLVVTLARSELGATSAMSGTLTCSFDLTSGAGTVPASLLGMIPPGTGGAFSFAAGDLDSATVGDYDVTGSATEIVSDSAGTLAGGQADFM